MLTAEIRVNGIIITYIYTVNMEKTFPYNRKNDEYIYRYEHYEPDKKLTKGIIKHRRSDGASILINKIINNVIKKNKKENN